MHKDSPPIPKTAKPIMSGVTFFFIILKFLCASFQITNFIYPFPVAQFLTHGDRLYVSKIYFEKILLALSLNDTDPNTIPQVNVNESQYAMSCSSQVQESSMLCCQHGVLIEGRDHDSTILLVYKCIQRIVV